MNSFEVNSGHFRISTHVTIQPVCSSFKPGHLTSPAVIFGEPNPGQKLYVIKDKKSSLASKPVVVESL